MDGRKGPARSPGRWGIILAGGEGIRLRSLTRAITGDERPKQFCTILGRETLLDQTRRRAALAIAPDRTLVVVTRAHERFYAPLLSDLPLGGLVAQPESRGTASAILYALLRVAERGPLDAAAVFPSDHYVSDDAGFMSHVEAAFEAVSARPDLVVLLGIAPDTPEVEYGWIDPGDPILAQSAHIIYRVRRFWEKPALPAAEALLARRCLWNSFVIVARAPAFLALIRGARFDLYERFVALRPVLGTSREEEAVRTLYAQSPSLNFSREILATRPANLAVLPVRGVAWSDWGQPGRVLASLARMGIRPAWASAALPRLA